MNAGLEFTGERFVPDTVPPEELYFEHWSRYFFVAQAVAGKRILDAGCGCGYGAALLAQRATQVVGIDVSPQAILYSQSHYQAPNLHFAIMDCTRLAFSGGVFDLVVALEVLEHIADEQVFLGEVKRALKPDGVFIVSTPNVETYPAGNVFHKREYSVQSLVACLSDFFPAVALHDQLYLYTVAVRKPAGNESQVARPTNGVFNPPEVWQVVPTALSRAREPSYYLAVCGRPESVSRCLLQLKSVLCELPGDRVAERTQWALQLEKDVIERTQRAQRLEAELVERTQWAGRLEDELQAIKAMWYYRLLGTGRWSGLLKRLRRDGLKLVVALGIVLALLPLILILGLVILIGDAVFWLWSQLQAEVDVPTPVQPDTRTASIIVVNWNGKDLLAGGLPAILAAVQQDRQEHEVIVVDNGSTDGSVDFVRAQFPGVRVIALSENLMFGGGNNVGVQVSQNDIVVLLNSDMVVRPDFLRPLLQAFDAEPNLFAASSQIFFWDESRRREETGKTRARFSAGDVEFWHEPVAAEDSNHPTPVFWAGGGSAAYDRRKFLELGGFDRLYEPFYVEDAALSYRAWKHGWKSVFVPASVVYHKHRGTVAPNFDTKYVANVIQKNRLLFFWHNITTCYWVLQHLIRLPYRILRLMMDGRLRDIVAFFWAVRQFPEVWGKRYRGRRRSDLSDAEIFRVTSESGYPA